MDLLDLGTGVERQRAVVQAVYVTCTHVWSDPRWLWGVLTRFPYRPLRVVWRG